MLVTKILAPLLLFGSSMAAPFLSATRDVKEYSVSPGADTDGTRVTRRGDGDVGTDGTRVTVVAGTDSVRITGDNRDMV